MRKLFAIIIATMFAFVYWLEIKRALKKVKYETKRICRENNLGWLDRKILETEIQMKAIDKLKL